MVTEFNSIQKYYQKKNEPEIIPRGLRSIYSRNNQLYTSNIIIIYSRFTKEFQKSLILTQNFNKIKH